MKKHKEKRNKRGLPKLPAGVRLLLYLGVLLLGCFSIWEASYSFFSPAADMAVYVAAALGLTAACCYLLQDIKAFRKKVRELIQKNALTNRIYTDYRYRTVLFTRISFLINLFYAVSNGILAIVNGSAWLGTLSAYYIFLSVMRSGIVRKEKALSKEKPGEDVRNQELKIYRDTGILLSLITIALAGAVILLLHREGGKSYQGYLIFVAAMYTFYKAIISIPNILRARKMKSPLLVSIRNIGYADALVSVLSLQTAMFASFGENSSIDQLVMNGATGAFVCVMILAIGIFMICSAGRQAAG